MGNSILNIATALVISNPFISAGGIFVADKSYEYVDQIKDVTLAEKSISLNNRYGNEYVNNVFKDNILLTLNYLNGDIKQKSDIDWGKVESPKRFEFSLKPSERFAFHDQILTDYRENIVKTTNAHFNFSDGFKSDGYLMGDGVCHLASLIYWVAKDAGLTSYAPTNHNFAVINEVPKEYGVSIYSLPNSYEVSARQNLYIQNNFDSTVNFIFEYDGNNLSLEITKSN